MKRTLCTLGLILGLTAAGASGASAWTFATKASPQSAIYNGVSFGDGAGNIYRSGYSTILIDVDLRDRVSNGRGIYQQTNAWKPGDTRFTAASAQTGRRSVNSWARMQQKKIGTTVSSVGSWASSKVCEDASLRPDICSTTKSSAL